MLISYCSCRRRSMFRFSFQEMPFVEGTGYRTTGILFHNKQVTGDRRQTNKVEIWEKWRQKNESKMRHYVCEKSWMEGPEGEGDLKEKTHTKRCAGVKIIWRWVWCNFFAVSLGHPGLQITWSRTWYMIYLPVCKEVFYSCLHVISVQSHDRRQWGDNTCGFSA